MLALTCILLRVSRPIQDENRHLLKVRQNNAGEINVANILKGSKVSIKCASIAGKVFHTEISLSAEKCLWTSGRQWRRYRLYG